nr:hypothetical protein [Tanacetum cinerariifolium]
MLPDASNCHRLKHYHGGDPPPLEIPDDYPSKNEDFLCRILSWFSRPSIISQSLKISCVGYCPGFQDPSPSFHNCEEQKVIELDRSLNVIEEKWFSLKAHK